MLRSIIPFHSMKQTKLPRLLAIFILALASQTQAADLADIQAIDVKPFKIPVVEGKQNWTSLPPDGIGINVWSPEGNGGVSVGEFEGEQAFVLSNTGAKPSVFLTLKDPFLRGELAAGKTYEVTISYATNGDPGANVILSATSPEGAIVVDTDAPQVPGKQAWKVELPAESGKWNTAKETLKVTEGAGLLEVQFHATKSGEDHLLGIRSIQVTDVTK